jgi:hypothetical protein
MHLKMCLQIDFSYEEECKGGSDNILADEYLATVDQDTFGLGFSTSNSSQSDKDGNPVIVIIDRSSIHEIDVKWCCCLQAPKCDMQLMAAELFLATFRNPKTAFTFQVLEKFYLDNLKCKTTPSQFFSCLRRLMSNKFPSTVPVG